MIHKLSPSANISQTCRNICHKSHINTLMRLNFVICFDWFPILLKMIILNIPLMKQFLGVYVPFLFVKIKKMNKLPLLMLFAVSLLVVGCGKFT